MTQYILFLSGILFTVLIQSLVQAPVSMVEVGYALEKCEANGGLQSISRFNEKRFVCVNGAQFIFPKEVRNG